VGAGVSLLAVSPTRRCGTDWSRSTALASRLPSARWASCRSVGPWDRVRRGQHLWVGSI